MRYDDTMEELTGVVTTDAFAPNSKSAHQGVYLETDAGRFVLRRPGANAFHDPELQALVGRRIAAMGEKRGYVLLVTGWRGLDDG